MTESRSDYTKKYFMFLLGKLKTCAVLSVIFAFCGFPVAAFAASSYRDRGLQQILAALAFISIAGNIVVSFAAPLIARNHLYARHSADNILSLPLTAFQRYICETGASLAVSLVPCILALPATLLLSSLSQSVFEYAVKMLLTLLMFVSLNMFLSGFCGRLAEAILYPAALNAVIPLLSILAVWISRANVYGADMFNTWYEAPLKAASFTSPAGYFICRYVLYGWDWEMLTALPYSAILLLLGYLVYRKRPVENIGQPFVYKKAYTVNSFFIAVGCVICYISMFLTLAKAKAGEAAVIAAVVLLVLLLILLLIMEFINYKRVKSIPKFLLKYVGTLAVGALVSFGLYMSEGFGESLYIPSAEDTLYIRGTMTEHDGMNSYHLVFCADGSGGLADIARAEQKNIIDRRADGEDSIYFEYSLKDGSLVMREYRTALPDNIFERITDSEEYRFSPLIGFEKDMSLTYDYSTGLQYRLMVRVPTSYEKISARIANVYTNKEYFWAKDIDYEALKAALTEDLKNDADFGRHSEAPLCSLMIGVVSDTVYGGDGETVWNSTTAEYTLYESYVNTIAFLKKYGNVPTAQQALTDAAEQCELISLVRYPVEDCRQTVIPATAYAFLSESNESSVFITADEFAENASSAGFISGGQEYAYFIRIGVPQFFDGDRIYGVDEKILPQLEESGLLGDKFTYDEIGNTVAYPQGSSIELLVSEEHYPQLEKYFSDRYVFRNID